MAKTILPPRQRVWFIAATIWNSLPSCPTPAVDLFTLTRRSTPTATMRSSAGETKEKRAFDDRHGSTRAYIDYMRPRCVQLARVLKKTGSFYYHCDWHASTTSRSCSTRFWEKIISSTKSLGNERTLTEIQNENLQTSKIRFFSTVDRMITFSIRLHSIFRRIYRKYYTHLMRQAGAFNW